MELYAVDGKETLEALAEVGLEEDAETLIDERTQRVTCIWEVIDFQLSS